MPVPYRAVHMPRTCHAHAVHMPCTYAVQADAATYSQLCLGNAVALECCALRAHAHARGGDAVQHAVLQALWSLAHYRPGCIEALQVCMH